MYETDILLCIVFILFFMYIESIVRDFLKFHRPFWNIRGPKTLPFTLIAYLFTARSGEDRFQILQNLSKRYPRYYSLWFGSKYLFVTDDCFITQKLLTYPSCVEKNFFMELFGFPKGLIAMKSDNWKTERKLLNSSFGLPVLQKYIPIFSKCIENSVQHLNENCDKGDFDIRHDITLVVMNAVMNTTFGKDISRDVAKAFMTNTEQLLDIIWQRSMKPHLYYDSIYSLTSLKKREDAHRKFIFDFISDEWMNLSENISSRENSFIEHLMRVSSNGRNFTTDEILDHCGTMLVAAGDTTSTALNFLLLMLAMHENVQHCIMKEINEVFGEDCRDLIIDYEKLSQLKYVEMAIKEALRLFPPSTGIFREVKEDVRLDIDDVCLPKGTNLVVNVYGLHRKKEIWGDDAHLFKPERFSTEKSNERHPYSFVPFASGIRMCIGNKYAMSLMKLIVAHYVKNFHFSTSLKYENVKVKAGITLKLIGDHRVQITKRKS